MAYGKLKVDKIETSAEELTLPTSAGSNGQVLTTDGSGVLSFTTNASGCDLSATANGTSLTVESSSGTNVALPAASSTAWGVMTDEDKAKIDAIEASATADQTGAEIKTAYEAESDTNAFTDAEKTKLSGIAASANNYAISADLLDEDDFATNSDAKAASQQSIKAYVDAEVSGLVDSAPSTLDTLNELAAALGDDANYAATVTTSLGLKAPLASPTFTGTVTLPDETITEAKLDVSNAPTDDYVLIADSSQGGGLRWAESGSSTVDSYRYLFLCPTGGSGAPTIDGNTATYDLRIDSNSGTVADVISAAQLIVSVNGVVQQANSGTSTSGLEGYVMMDSNTIKFADNLPSGASVFITQMGKVVDIGTPADGSVTSAKLDTNIDIAGTLDVTSTATFDGSVTVHKAAVGTVGTLTDAATVAVDMSLSNNFTLTTTSGVGNTRQLGTPSNATAGQSGVIWVHQDGTGSRELTYEAEWKFAGGTAPTLTTDASAVDCLAYSVLASDKVLVTAIKKVS